MIKLHSPDLSSFPVVAAGVFLALGVMILPLGYGCGFGGGIWLPNALGPAIYQPSKRDLVLSVTRQSECFIDTKWFPDAEFQSALATLHERSDKRRIVLRVDRRVPFKAVRGVMRSIARAGFQHILLATPDESPLALITRHQNRAQ